jgi:hypothetical protein
MTLAVETAQGDHVMETDVILSVYADAVQFERVDSLTADPYPSVLMLARVSTTTVYRDGTVRRTTGDKRAWGKGASMTVLLPNEDDGSTVVDAWMDGPSWVRPS